MKILGRIWRRLRSTPSDASASIMMSENPRFNKHQVGEWSYGNPLVICWGEETKLIVGKFCSIADNVTILLGGEHRTDWITTYPFSVLFDEAKHISGHPASKGDVVIGNDVWIGRDTLIRSGVRIGNGAVIGAGSVVTKDVASYSITAGNPARHIRYRFYEQTIKDLEEIAWWDLSLSEIRVALPLLLSTDVQAFIDGYLIK